MGVNPVYLQASYVRFLSSGSTLVEETMLQQEYTYPQFRLVIRLPLMAIFVSPCRADGK